MENKDYINLVLDILEDERSTITEVMYLRVGDQAQIDYSNAQLNLINKLITRVKNLSKEE